MKTTLLLGPTCGLLLSAATQCQAQKHGTQPLLESYAETETSLTPQGYSRRSFAAAHPAKLELAGYWMVETSFTPQEYSIVRFYDGHNSLVYEEGLVTLYPDLSKRTRRRTSCQLAIVLQSVLRAPATRAAGNLLAQQLRSHGLIQRAAPVARLATTAE